MLAEYSGVGYDIDRCIINLIHVWKFTIFCIELKQKFSQVKLLRKWKFVCILSGNWGINNYVTLHMNRITSLTIPHLEGHIYDSFGAFQSIMSPVYKNYMRWYDSKLCMGNMLNN